MHKQKTPTIRRQPGVMLSHTETDAIGGSKNGLRNFVVRFCLIAVELLQLLQLLLVPFLLIDIFTGFFE